MSMNLCWNYKRSFDEFWFQTPTDLTFDVLDASTNEKRWELIHNYMVESKWDEVDIQSVKDHFDSKLEDGWTLTYI